jgi:hypothetical protein
MEVIHQIHALLPANYRSWEQPICELVFFISFAFLISNSLLPTWAIVSLGIIESTTSLCFLCR